MSNIVKSGGSKLPIVNALHMQYGSYRILCCFSNQETFIVAFHVYGDLAYDLVPAMPVIQSQSAPSVDDFLHDVMLTV